VAKEGGKTPICLVWSTFPTLTATWFSASTRFVCCCHLHPVDDFTFVSNRLLIHLGYPHAHCHPLCQTQSLSLLFNRHKPLPPLRTQTHHGATWGQVNVTTTFATLKNEESTRSDSPSYQDLRRLCNRGEDRVLAPINVL
jgi:hypothetical protein